MRSGRNPLRPGAAGRQMATTNFAKRVLSVVRRIPAGKVATYGDVARMAGRARAHRAVGNIMRECRLPDVPCHRVIGAGGAIGGYGGNLELKRNLLRAEGLSVGLKRIQEFANCRWDPPSLTALRELRRTTGGFQG